MTSFIELPRLGFRGIDQPSLFVNVDDILAFESYCGQTRVHLRNYGSEGCAGIVTTYAPISALIITLEATAWAASTLPIWAEPIKAQLAEQAERERDGRG